jgi:hypothetical protein
MRHGYDYRKYSSIVLDGKARGEEKSGPSISMEIPGWVFSGVVLFALCLCFMAGRKTDQGHGYIDVIRALVIGHYHRLRDE